MRIDNRVGLCVDETSSEWPFFFLLTFFRFLEVPRIFTYECILCFDLLDLDVLVDQPEKGFELYFSARFFYRTNAYFKIMQVMFKSSSIFKYLEMLQYMHFSIISTLYRESLKPRIAHFRYYMHECFVGGKNYDK